MIDSSNGAERFVWRKGDVVVIQEGEGDRGPAKPTRTRKGNRTAWFRVQIVEQQPGGQIVMFFDKPHDDLSPINFSASDGRSGPKAHEKLRSILDREPD